MVGDLDIANPEATGAWDQVIDSRGDLKKTLVGTLMRIDPATIAINYAHHNVKADGLSYGKFLWLQAALDDTPFLQRLVSAEELITKLRGCKLPQEVAMIRSAIVHTDDIFEAVNKFLQPGQSGREIYAFIHE
jgi:Xaa-Pro aminopeptidase